MNLVEADENVNSVIFKSEPNTEYIVKSKRVYKEDFRPFGMAAPFKHKDSRKNNMDLVDKLMAVSKAAGLVFQEIKNSRCQNLNIATMTKWKELTTSELRSVYRKVAELQSVGLIVKVKPVEDKIHKPPKFTYMINPYYIKPWEYTKACKAWELLGGKLN